MRIAALSGMKFTRETRREWLRFLAVGGVNTAFSYGLYALFIYLGAGYLVASFMSMVGGIAFNYRTTGALVFRARGAGSFPRFAGCYALVLAFSVTTLEILDSLGVNAYLSGILVAAPAAVLSFILLRTFAFPRGVRT